MLNLQEDMGATSGIATTDDIAPGPGQVFGLASRKGCEKPKKKKIKRFKKFIEKEDV